MKSAEAELKLLANKFLEFRRNRPSPRSRLPEELWDLAIKLSGELSPAQVGKACGINPSYLRHYKPKKCLGVPDVRIARVGEGLKDLSFGSSSIRVTMKSGTSELVIESCSETSLANIVRVFMAVNQ
jgi:hypothetical protein